MKRFTKRSLLALSRSCRVVLFRSVSIPFMAPLVFYWQFQNECVQNFILYEWKLTTRSQTQNDTVSAAKKKWKKEKKKNYENRMRELRWILSITLIERLGTRCSSSPWCVPINSLGWRWFDRVEWCRSANMKMLFFVPFCSFAFIIHSSFDCRLTHFADLSHRNAGEVGVRTRTADRIEKFNFIFASLFFGFRTGNDAFVASRGNFFQKLCI